MPTKTKQDVPGEKFRNRFVILYIAALLIFFTAFLVKMWPGCMHC